ncbi:MAG: hypothetical protein AAF361_01995, partial [Bacteroidota bacterium]
MLKLRQNYLVFFLLVLLVSSCKEKSNSADTEAETEEEMVQRALEIHKAVLTVDTHADTPLRMIEPGFDMAERHDPNETGSK